MDKDLPVALILINDSELSATYHPNYQSACGDVVDTISQAPEWTDESYDEDDIDKIVRDNDVEVAARLLMNAIYTNGGEFGMQIVPLHNVPVRKTSMV